MQSLTEFLADSSQVLANWLTSTREELIHKYGTHRHAYDTWLKRNGMVRAIYVVSLMCGHQIWQSRYQNLPKLESQTSFFQKWNYWRFLKASWKVPHLFVSTILFALSFADFERVLDRTGFQMGSPNHVFGNHVRRIILKRCPKTRPDKTSNFN